MMLSLPIIAPREHLFTKPAAQDAQDGIPRTHSIANTSPRRSTPSRSSLMQLRTDEHIIELRKLNVKRFGAGWLRPPGVTKTLQSKLEEAQEQLEQVETQRRDAEMRAQEEAAQHAAMGMQEQNGEGLADQEQRDLDADVPEAEQSALASDEDPDYTANVTFSEASLVEGSPSGERQAVLEMEDAELEGRLQDERDLGMEGDLDDDIPDAGSYEHTDTELEDDSSDEGEVSQAVNQNRTSARRDDRARMSFLSEQSEMLDSSSFVESSPAIARRTARGENIFGSSMRRGRPRLS